jgi:hypothetical protein
MTREQPDDETEQRVRPRLAAAGILTAALVVSCILVAATAPAVADQSPTSQKIAVQEENNSTINNSKYYNGSMNVNNESWFAGIGDADLDSLGQLATRAVNYFIGTGSMDASGTGFQGILITGLVMGISMIGAIAGVGVGSVGGSVIAVVIGFGMTEIGLAPAWFRVILLFGIGIIAFISLTNILEAR